MRRRYRLINLLSAVIAVSTALSMIAALPFAEGAPAAYAALLLQIGGVVAGLAVLVGVLNLLSVHLRRLRNVRQGGFYSFVVILTFIAVIVLRLLNVKDEADREISGIVFNAVQVSLESALAGLLFFFLVYAAYRLLSQRVTWSNVLFSVVLIAVLLAGSLLQDVEVVGNLRNWLLEIPVTAGSRGLLIGVGLATVAASLRVLVGQERAYREE